MHTVYMYMPSGVVLLATFDYLVIDKTYLVPLCVLAFTLTAYIVPGLLLYGLELSRDLLSCLLTFQPLPYFNLRLYLDV